MHVKGKVCAGIATMAMLFYCWQSATAQSFTAAPATGCTPLSVQFSSSVPAGTVSYHWDFGNGKTSTLANPGAIYTLPGKYTVLLNITDASGNGQTIRKPDLIIAADKPNVQFSASVRQGCVPLSTNFSDLSKAYTGNISKWLWDFGDGYTSTAQNPSHSYATAGAYAVSLTVEDAYGCKNTVSKTAFIRVIPSPVFSIKASDSLACDPDFSVQFNCKLSSPLGQPLSFLWDFGDGSSSTKANPSHTYTAHGSYSVSLQVTDTAGCSSTVTKKNYIYVGKSEANFFLQCEKGLPALECSVL